MVVRAGRNRRHKIGVLEACLERATRGDEKEGGPQDREAGDWNGRMSWTRQRSSCVRGEPVYSPGARGRKRDNEAVRERQIKREAGHGHYMCHSGDDVKRKRFDTSGGRVVVMLPGV